MNTKIKKLFVASLATSSIFCTIPSYADQTGVIYTAIGGTPQLNKVGTISAGVYDLLGASPGVATGTNLTASGVENITLVFGSNNNLVVDANGDAEALAAAGRINKIDLYTWSTYGSTKQITLNNAINPSFYR